MGGGTPDIPEMQARLAAWLKKKLPDARDLSVSNLEKPGMGLSSETFLFDLSWQQAGEPKSKGVVLRSAPRDSGIFPDYDLGLQFRIMEILKHTDVPVATMMWREEDPSVLGSPFFLMEKLDGEVPQDYPPYHGSGMFHDATPEQRAKMWWGSLEALARIHLLDWKALGLSFLGVPAGGTDPVDRQMAYWERYFAWMKDDPQEPHPTLEASLDWLRRNRYAPERVTLCWGDARMGNTLYSKPDRDVLAIMDWEMAFLGDPETDLAWFILLDWQHSGGAGLPRCAGTPSYEETVRRYESITGWKVKHLLYNEVLSAVRYGMIVVTVLKKLKRQGIPIDEEMILNNVCTQRLSELLDLPSPGPKRTETASLDEVTVSVQLCFTGQGGYDWFLVSERGRVTRHEGRIEEPTCTIAVSLDDWLAIQDGTLNRLEAWTSGRLVTEGDMNVMIQMEEAISAFAQQGRSL